MGKIEILKEEKSQLIKEMGDTEIKLYSIDKEIEKTRKHNISSAKWYKKLSEEKKKIRNLKHLLKYYENKVKENK